MLELSSDLKSRGLSADLQNIGNQGAHLLGKAKGAERLDKASTHWMRHSHASHAIASGMPIEIAQQNLGHASLATTTVYVTTEKRRRMKAVDDLAPEKRISC